VTKNSVLLLSLFLLQWHIIFFYSFLSYKLACMNLEAVWYGFTMIEITDHVSGSGHTPTWCCLFYCLHAKMRRSQAISISDALIPFIFITLKNGSENICNLHQLQLKII
jgi:hypothetical protein